MGDYHPGRVELVQVRERDHEHRHQQCHQQQELQCPESVLQRRRRPAEGRSRHQDEEAREGKGHLEGSHVASKLHAVVRSRYDAEVGAGGVKVPEDVLQPMLHRREHCGGGHEDCGCQQQKTVHRSGGQLGGKG